MAKRHYTFTFEKDEMLGWTVSYLEEIDGRKSDQPTDEYGKLLFEQHVDATSKLGIEKVFKSPDERILEIKVDLEGI